MKIFNKAKTHFMHTDKNGIVVKFDTIENVQTRINSILDGIDRPSVNNMFEFEIARSLEPVKQPD